MSFRQLSTVLIFIIFIGSNSCVRIHLSTTTHNARLCFMQGGRWWPNHSSEDSRMPLKDIQVNLGMMTRSIILTEQIIFVGVRTVHELAQMIVQRAVTGERTQYLPCIYNPDHYGSIASLRVYAPHPNQSPARHNWNRDTSDYLSSFLSSRVQFVIPQAKVNRCIQSVIVLTVTPWWDFCSHIPLTLNNTELICWICIEHILH